MPRSHFDHSLLSVLIFTRAIMLIIHLLPYQSPRQLHFISRDPTLGIERGVMVFVVPS